MESKNLIKLKTGKVLTLEEADEAKRLYEVFCTQEYLEDNFSGVIPKDNMWSVAVSVRRYMNKYSVTENEAIEEILKEILKTQKKGGCL